MCLEEGIPSVLTASPSPGKSSTKRSKNSHDHFQCGEKACAFGTSSKQKIPRAAKNDKGQVNQKSLVPAEPGWETKGTTVSGQVLACRVEAGFIEPDPASSLCNRAGQLPHYILY